MKAVPRRAEREVAALLSSHFTKLGMDPVERIPVLGRTGPDISINQMGMVIDVKSRKEVPSMSRLRKGELVAFGTTLIGIRLDELPGLWETRPVATDIRPYSKMIVDWYGHMDEWTKANYPDGVSALALRRPGMPFGETTIVIDLYDWRKLHDRTTNRDCWLSTINQPATLFQAG